MTAYAELAVTTNFSFLRGGSHPEELVAGAARLGLAGIAVADRNTLAGVVRAHSAAKAADFPYAVGCRLVFRDGTPDILAWPTDRAAYGRLCRLLTLGNRRAEKGECHLDLADLLEWGKGLILGVMPGRSGFSSPDAALDGGRTGLEPRAARSPVLRSGQPARRDARPARRHLPRHRPPDGQPPLRTRRPSPPRSPRSPRPPVPACRSWPPTTCSITPPSAARCRTCSPASASIGRSSTAGQLLAANAERHFKDAAEMARLFRDYPEALAETPRCLRTPRLLPRRAPLPVSRRADRGGRQPPGGARTCWPRKAPASAIPTAFPTRCERASSTSCSSSANCNYAPYFLTVHDIVRFAAAEGHPLPGTRLGGQFRRLLLPRHHRGRSRALRTPLRALHLGRAQRAARHRRRLRARAARGGDAVHLCEIRPSTAPASPRPSSPTAPARRCARSARSSASREDTVDALVRDHLGLVVGRRPRGRHPPRRPRPGKTAPCARSWTSRSELIGFPRHLSQHVGGFVMTRDRLDEMVPMMNAAMEDRTTSNGTRTTSTRCAC